MTRYTPPETHADVGFHLGQVDLAQPHAEVKAFHSQDDGSHEFTILRLGFGTTRVCFFLPSAAAAIGLLDALAAACAPHQNPPGLEPTADPGLEGAGPCPDCGQSGPRDADGLCLTCQGTLNDYFTDDDPDRVALTEEEQHGSLRRQELSPDPWVTEPLGVQAGYEPSPIDTA